jgi:hypothetical protein
MSKRLESLYQNLLNGKLPHNLSWSEAVGHSGEGPFVRLLRSGLVSTISFSGVARMDYSLLGNNVLKDHR